MKSYTTENGRARKRRLSKMACTSLNNALKRMQSLLHSTSWLTLRALTATSKTLSPWTPNPAPVPPLRAKHQGPIDSWSEPLNWHTKMRHSFRERNHSGEKAILPEISANGCRTHGD